MKLEIFPHDFNHESARLVSKCIEQFIGDKYTIVKTDIISRDTTAFIYVWYEDRKRINKKQGMMQARYKCLVCNHTDVIKHSSEEELKDVLVCPNCNGAFVDTFKMGQYSNDIKTIVNKLDVNINDNSKDVTKEMIRELSKAICNATKTM